jgi:hypothetical protein
MKNYKTVAKAALKPTVTSPSSTPAWTSPAPATPVAKAPAAAIPAAPIHTTPVHAAPLPPAPVPAASAALTTIDVKLDVGFGNALFLRGQGAAGLTWERGLPLVCVDAHTWRWSGMVKAPIKFKVLINDKIWSAGNDLTIAPGQKLELAPAFA